MRALLEALLGPLDKPKVVLAIAAVLLTGGNGVAIPNWMGASSEVQTAVAKGEKTADQLTDVYVELAGQVAELREQNRVLAARCASTP